MDINTLGRKVGRFVAVAGLAIAMSGCGMALEDPPPAKSHCSWNLSSTDDFLTMQPPHLDQLLKVECAGPV